MKGLPIRKRNRIGQLPLSSSSSSSKKTDGALDRHWKCLLVLLGLVFLNLVCVTQFVPLDGNGMDNNNNNSNSNDNKNDNELISTANSDTKNDRPNNNNGNRNGNSNNKHNYPPSGMEADGESPLSAAANNTKDVDNGNNNNRKNKNSNDSDKKEEAIKHIPRKESRRNKIRKPKDLNRTLTPEEKIKYTIIETAIMPNVSNSVYYRDIPAEFLVPDPARFLWDRNDTNTATATATNAHNNIPEWMKDYFRWHRYKRSTWNLTDWKSERWLISQCLMSQDQKKCGGTADRLKPVPTLLRRAWLSKRVYLIRWTRPGRLEEFLVPPVGGFDWRVPEELATIMDDDSNGKRLSTRRTIEQYSMGGMALVRSRFQTDTPGLHYNNWVFGENYTNTGITSSNGNANENENTNTNETQEPDFDRIFPSVWNIVFTPSRPIQEIIRVKLKQMDLVPNQYAASHLRALYSVKERKEQIVEKFTSNALACATELLPNAPIFFASDSAVAIRHALELSRNNNDGNNNSGNDSGGMQQQQQQQQQQRRLPFTKVVSAYDPEDDNKSPMHLDAYIAPVEQFYNTFVDLYLMAIAKCITYNKGGFGHWAMLIGGSQGCTKQQFTIGRRIQNEEQDFCHFPGVGTATTTTTTSEQNERRQQPQVDTTIRIFGNDGDEGPLFLPPMY